LIDNQEMETYNMMQLCTSCAHVLCCWFIRCACMQ